MYHPLYYRAVRLVGRPVCAHHICGRMHHGTLLHVTHGGIFLLPYPAGARLAGADGEQARPVRACAGQTDAGAQLAYAPAPPAVYFAFGALTGLTIAALAAPFVW